MSENDLENGETEADRSYSKRKRSLPNARTTSNIDSDIYEMCDDPCGETEADGKGGSTGKRGVPNNQSNNVDSDIYEMCGDPCGKCIIFNQNFSNHCNLETRYGTNFDRDRLHNLFVWLKFKVIIYEDNTKDEMEEILKVEALDEKNEEFKCLVVCILSHGEEGGIYTADWKFIKLHEILRRFDTSRCRLMENKPKIFIVQACRIESNLIYINPAKVPSEKNEESTGIAINADQILYQSTSYGSSALRNTHYGSSFIQTFCTVYETKASESSFDDLALEINKRVGDTNLIMCAIEPNRLRKKLYFKPDTPFNVNKDTQPHLIKTRWKVTIISHSPKKCIEEIEKQAKKFKIKDKSNKHILIDRGPNETESMRFNHWKKKECNEYVKRYYDNVDFFLFNYGSTDDIPDGFKSFIEKNKPSFVIRNYNLFKHFDFLKRADALNFQQKESLKRIKHMDHIGFDPKRNAIYFFKISDRNTVHDIRGDVDDCAAFVRIFFLLHRRELINKITCLVSFVVVPTESLLENVSNRCDNCGQYLITEEQFQKFDQKLCDKIRKTVSCANKKDRIKLTDEELKEFKYNMKGIFACMATQDGNLIPNLTENTAEQLKHIEIFLYPQQMEIANFNDEHVILKGSYGSGKTVIGRLLVKHLCFDSPNELIYYINCGTSSDFTEDMEKYVKCIDKNINVVCLHSKKALGIILKEIKQNNSSAVKIHLIFEEVSLDEFTDKDILSFCAALNREPFHNTFCYIICQAMSNERSFTKNGVHYKRSFSNQEEILKEKSAFKMKKLEIAVRNTQNIDLLIEIGMKHLENAVNKFFFKTIENFEFQKGTSSESFKQKEDKKGQVIQSQNQTSIQSLIQTSNAENISAEEQTHEEEINIEPFIKRPFKAKEILSNLDASLKNVNILDNNLHENQEDHVKRYLESRFQYIKHSDLLHQIQGNKPRVYFPLDKKDDYDQFEEAYLLMQCFKDLLYDFFSNDENIILIHFENNIPQTISKAINLFEMIEQTKVENILFKTCLDVQGLEYKNVIIVLDIGEYHMRHYLIEAMARCKENLAFLVVKESLKGTDQDLILNIIQEWEEKDLITKFNQYSTKRLNEHKEQYEHFLRVCPIQSSDDEIKKKMESIEEYLSLYKPIDSKEEDSSSEEEISKKNEEMSKMLHKISKYMAGSWKRISRILGLNENVIETIDQKINDTQQCAYQALYVLNQEQKLEWHKIEAALKDDINASYQLQEIMDKLGETIPSFQKNLPSKDIPDLGEEIAKRVSEWTAFARVLGTPDHQIRQLGRDYSTCFDRSYNIMKQFCHPLPINNSWAFWKKYLLRFIEGRLIIYEMETVFPQLINECADSICHCSISNKTGLYFHQTISFENDTLLPLDEKRDIAVNIGGDGLKMIHYQNYKQFEKSKREYFDSYKILLDIKTFDFTQNKTKCCDILQTIQCFLNETKDDGFAFKGYSLRNHYTMIGEIIIPKEQINKHIIAYFSNENILMHIKICYDKNELSKLLNYFPQEVRLAQSVHECIRDNAVVHIGVVLIDDSLLDDQSIYPCNKCVEKHLMLPKSCFSNINSFKEWYEKVVKENESLIQINEQIYENKELTNNLISRELKENIISQMAIKSNDFPTFTPLPSYQIKELDKLEILLFK